MSITTCCVPNTGGTASLTVSETCVTVGQLVQVDQLVVILESDKAVLEVPSNLTGVVTAVLVTIGQLVKTGDALIELSIQEIASLPDIVPAHLAQAAVDMPKDNIATVPAYVASPAPFKSADDAITTSPNTALQDDLTSWASPMVRRLAMRLGVTLSALNHPSSKRITLNDVEAYVRQRMNTPISTLSTPEDTMVPLSRLKKLSGQQLQKNWTSVPHVTQMDQADITDLESFRVQNSTPDHKLTLLPFIIKAVCMALKQHPWFNAMLEDASVRLIHAYHIGIAMETPDGLLVPVVHHADRQSVQELAQCLKHLSVQAKQKKLTPEALSGSTFSISSLGGIGGSFFTPIVNCPNVAILGVSRTVTQPIWQDNGFVPRQCLPLSLSYDHRVIDGADGARFIRTVIAFLEDIRRWSL
jgi:pyruvate dehydrogenase E2 component (dihydrolipoamide acetyltransferase)